MNMNMKATASPATLLLRFCLSLLAAACLLAGCSEWNETEPLELKVKGAKERAPELWTRYMEVLRDYKNSSHFLTYARFDNGADKPVNEGGYLRSLPDSLDIVTLAHPDRLTGFDKEDIPSLQEKSTKVLLLVDYAGIAGTELGDVSRLGAYLDKITGLAAELGLDGFAFTCNPLYSGTDAEIAARKEAAALIVSRLSSAAGASGTLVFEGLPEALEPSDIAKLSLLVAPTADLDNVVDLKLMMAGILSAPGISKDKVLLSASIGGEMADGNNVKKSQVPLIMDYVASLGPLGGLAIRGIGDDYYNSAMNYAVTRSVIRSMNPSR